MRTEKALRYITLCNKFHTTPLDKYELDEMRMLRRYFSILNWNYSMCRVYIRGEKTKSPLFDSEIDEWVMFDLESVEHYGQTSSECQERVSEANAIIASHRNKGG